MAGKRGRIGLVVLISLFVVVSYLMFHAGRFKGIVDINAMDYGQLAYNMSKGRGYTTKFIRPLSLARFPQVERHPEVIYAPLHPYVASLFMRTMPDKARALALSCGLGFLLGAPVVFFLGWQLFDLRTGLLGLTLYLTNIMYLNQSISGLEGSWLTLWVTLLLLVCYVLSRKLRWRYVLATIAGVVMALIYLTQYIWLAVLPVVAVYIFVSTDKSARWRVVGVFVIAFGLAISPWCVRNMRVTGHPLFTYRAVESIMATRTNPGNTLYRQFTTDYPSLAWYILDRPFEMVEKLRNGFVQLYGTLAGLAGLYVTPFFIVAMVVILGSRTFERLRYLWYGMFAVMAVVLAMVAVADRLMMPLGPAAGVIAAGFFLRLLDTRIGDLVPRLRRRWLTLAIGLLLCLHALPAAFSVLRFHEIAPEERMNAVVGEAVREVVGITDGTIITDVPWYLAWHGDRTAIWLPKTRTDLRNMEDKVGKIKWLLLTPQVADQRYDANERTLKEWGPAWKEGHDNGDIEFEGYKAYKRIAGTDWVLFQANPQAKRDLPPEIMKQYEGIGEPADAGAARGAKKGR